MKRYLIIHQSEIQSYAEAESIDKIQFKYQETVIAIIPLTQDFIESVISNDVIKQGHYA